MDLKKAETEIALLDRQIDNGADDPALYFERGKIYYGMGRLDMALNDFVRVRDMEPDNREAAEYVAMISEIFDFQYKDTYNP